jgi:hypothetical protein
MRKGLAALFLVAFSLGSVQAQDLFEVTGLQVDESSTDDVRAKDEGLAKAQQQALDEVFRRLVSPDNYARLPQVNADLLYDLVRDYDILDEKFGGGRYIATISVRLEPEEVANVLRSQQIPYAMTRSLPVVVLPVIDSGTARRLWDDPNPWRNAWAGRLPNPGLFSLIMPIGDLSDVAAINVTHALAGDPVGLEEIARKYDAAGAVVAIATITQGSSGRVVNVTMSFHGGSYDGSVVERSYTGGGSLQAFLDEVVAELLRDLEMGWKDANMLDFTQVERISVLVPIQGLGGWIEIRERLNSMSRIQEVAIARMTREEAEVDIVYVGNTEQLRSALAQQGLELFYSPENPLWLLRPFGSQ